MKRIILFSDASKIMLLLMVAVFVLSACGPGNSAQLPEKGPVQEENGLQDGILMLRTLLTSGRHSRKKKSH